MMHSNSLSLNLSQTKPCLLGFCHIPHISHLCRAKSPSYSVCSKFLSLTSAKLCIQDKGRFTTLNHEYDSLWYSSSGRHQVLEGKGFVLKADIRGGVCAVRGSFLEFSCPSWTLPHSFWGYWCPHFLISFKCLQIYRKNEGYFTLFRYIVSFLPFLVSKVPTFKRKTVQSNKIIVCSSIYIFLACKLYISLALH